MFQKLKSEIPVLSKLIELRETFWLNPNMIPSKDAFGKCGWSMENILEAENRLKRFAPYIAKAFPETKKSGGIIESNLCEAETMLRFLRDDMGTEILGRLIVKCDSHLPVSGSIKARGGIYEVLAHAERLALQSGMLSVNDDYSVLHSEKYREFFSRHSLSVASTGNLGLSVGIMGAMLGFKTTVHMSSDAREWKKKLLREKGAEVIEYGGDYSMAVEKGRLASGNGNHFVDDENSPDLFLGYSTAALRLKNQLQQMNITVDGQHPLFVYLPCGVGGGPGGVAFGLKCVYGDAVHCFFAEPTHAPCMLLGLSTGLHDGISVQDIGIDGKTCADGLAVGRASRFVGKLIEPFLSGAYTVSDNRLFYLLSHLADLENLWLEPSATAGFHGLTALFGTSEGQKYLSENTAGADLNNATHIIWATGGSMVPKETMQEYYRQGKAVSKEMLI